ncbi:protein TIFY 6B isoform X1 [Gossypium raimondii]|uniref:Protein TIFY n=2 Tax=Gossypium raimondii TaxID=29730 RepID=A0A0D2UXK5_GOSRA|nr:protein TIFY 6B isoform X1 [Gossypium raimondii]KJB60900.1 hypothetical protein B456_009G330500 [Gossypium raimondii]
MERDFLGLNSKQSFPLVKEEVEEIGFTKSLGIQWPISNKFSSAVPPQPMSFDFAQGDNAKRIGYDSIVSSTFMHISPPDAAELQKSFNHNRQRVGNHFPFTAASSVQHDVHHVQRPYDMKMFPVSNQSVPVSTTNPFMNSHFTTTAMKSQLLGGIPVTTPTHSVLPTLGSFGGSIEPRKSVRGLGDSRSPVQLTIFYAGTVNVYDDITPEKAQAIMLLAGNGSSLTSNVAHPNVQVQAPISKPLQFETLPTNHFTNAQLCSGIPSPLSVSSHTGVQSRSGSTSTDEKTVCKTTGSLTTPISLVEAPKLANTMGPVTPTSMMPSVPQARKASLAWFLEKRKERIMTASPYDLSKKPPHCTTQESNA